VRACVKAIAAGVAIAFAVAAHAAGFVDVLDTPARASPLAAKAPLQAIAAVGKRLVAVGQRGHVLVSSDAGATWTQSKVPVASDLTAVFFADEANGWAVGHDGVILRSSDGGDSWELQLDGARAAAAIAASMQAPASADPRSERAQALLAEARRFAAQGADKPFLDVWFADARNGYAVGAYNLLFKTADGGRTWESWFDRSDNPKLFNLYAIRPAAGALFIAGEGGLVLRLDEGAQRFRAVAVPYAGSFFGIAGAGASAIVFGLRGNAYASADSGATWARLDAGLGGTVVAATRTRKGALLLADGAGRIASSIDGGRTFTPLTVRPSSPITGLADVGGGYLALVGPRGATLARVMPR
jgi:photosystem II stability/assembly factor-like uncharacterized protein